MDNWPWLAPRRWQQSAVVRVPWAGLAGQRDLMASDASLEATKGQPWTALEIEATIAAYFEMLRMELRGERFRKTEIVRRLESMIPARNSRAIEAKFQNISAIRDEAGLLWIDGYKPLPHYQHALKVAVLSATGTGHRIGETLEAYESAHLAAPRPRRQATDDVLVPVPGAHGAGGRRTSVALTGGQFSALRDFQKRQLGTAGEEWVVELERESLKRSGRPDLADGVVWTARDVGDGAGYDVASFRADGSERLIEVKTTNLGPRTPFYITRWEIDVSRERADVYSLYRVHGFARDPRIYVLDGSVEERARLEPKIFLGIPI